jgi:hypothetical protein
MVESPRFLVVVSISPLPCWRDLSEARHHAACAEIVAAIEADTRAERVESGRACVGRDRIFAQDPHGRPVASDTSPHQPRAVRPCVRPRDQDRLPTRLSPFFDAFRAAAASLRRGEKAEFPAGAFPPGGPFVVAPPAPA